MCVCVCVYIIKAEEWREKNKKKKRLNKIKEPLYDDQIIKKIKRTTKTKYKIRKINTALVCIYSMERECFYFEAL